MLKPKHIDISTTNMALFGSPLEREIKKASAEHEEAWQGLRGKVGLSVWRIEKFHVVPWPKEKYGEFYRGDSYIVLNTFKSGDELKYDVHFWLGSSTTADEAGTACYKTVELDTLLDDLPAQHRETEGHETELFHSYFPHGLRFLEGGIETGFRHVEPESYQPRLLQVKGTIKTVSFHQVPIGHHSLNSGDVFILDLGLKLYQWNGSGSNGAERNKAARLIHAIAEDERKGLGHVYVVDEGSEDEEFWSGLGGSGPIQSSSEAGSDAVRAYENILMRLSDSSGSLTFTEVGRGSLSRASLSSEDTYILDNGAHILAWIGKKASVNERKLAIQYAHDYIVKHGLPTYIPISRILEGGENAVWTSSFAA